MKKFFFINNSDFIKILQFSIEKSLYIVGVNLNNNDNNISILNRSKVIKLNIYFNYKQLLIDKIYILIM